MAAEARIRLIVNADDFGISSSANRAILQAHRHGILTTASLMVAGEAAAEAVQFAGTTPTLGVGLHLTVIKGRSTLPAAEIPGLVSAKSEFDEGPVSAGVRYFFSRKLQPVIDREIQAQFESFRRTRLSLDHVNGHLHFHLHPTVFSVLQRHAVAWGIRHMRLTREPLFLNLKISGGHYAYRLSHAMVFACLSRFTVPALKRLGVRHTDRVFGMLQNDRVTETYLVRLLEHLTPGTYEVYAHPDEHAHAHELEALCSPRVRAMVENRGIQLIRYSDL